MADGRSGIPGKFQIRRKCKNLNLRRETGSVETNEASQRLIDKERW